MNWIWNPAQSARPGSILFDGLCTMNIAKILWGSFLSALLAIGIDQLLILVEQKSRKSSL